jgi:hypothetical protein
MKPKDLKVYAYVDSNYATNKETRKSVTGFVLTIGGYLVSYISKSHPSVTLSSTEAEYVAASMCATEVKFVQMLLEKLMPNAKTQPCLKITQEQFLLWRIRRLGTRPNILIFVGII